MTKSDWRIRGEELKRTMDTPGWQIVLAHLDAQRDSHLASLGAAKSEFELVHAHAKYVACKDLGETMRGLARHLLTVDSQ